MHSPLFLRFLLLSLLLQTSCLVVEHPHAAIAPGRWRGVLKLTQGPLAPPDESEFANIQFEEVTEGELPFLFDVVYDDDTHFHLEILNGEERLRVDHIQFGRDPSTAKDTILIDFPVYDSYIKALHENDVIEGEWVINFRDNYRIPFIAHFGRGYRFTELKKAPVMDLTGKWEVAFEVDTEEPYPAIGEFKQDGNALTGTFLTETGDYRYLEGTVQADKFYLSCFDGAHAFLFEGKILADSTLVGSFRSGTQYQTVWEGKRNPDFQLRDADSITMARDGAQVVNLQLEDPFGKVVSINDPEFAGKVKVIQIMGTWCPNCRDETAFLREYVSTHPNEDFAVIGVAFERYQEKEKAMNALRRYVENLQLPYPILLAGLKDQATAESVFPMLPRINAYPTMLFLDRQNRIRRIHTGFSGPATSEYAAFQADFDQYLQTLLAEK
ncbi:MAG: TlpA family protein disulfide reductase [Saprospirales bacterium]|nr:TlpA family protein disulfide reductase [Saprospirales bacterium]MBK8492113.1 TlpA family protein disulfide reductase [Saprospirales bacterium]